jgi:hypothetical protein
MAGLLLGGVALASQDHSVQSLARKVGEDVALAAATIIFIDGNNYPNGSTRMDTQIDQQYQYDASCAASPCTHLTTPTTSNFDFINNTAIYPATLGLYNGIGAPSGNQSVADGQAAIAQQVSEQSGNTPITVVGYSEGAVAASNEVTASDLPTGTSFVLIADAERPNGGILARLPTGTYIPLLGITAGPPTSSTAAPVVMVTQEYDGIGDAPAYPLNVVADANAVLGFYYLHGNYYPVNPNGPGTVVTTSPNGNMTDILVLAPVGDLPVLMPLAAAGVPQPILVALDPAVRAIIDTGYDRTSNPAQQVMFALLPPVSAWPADVQSVVAGLAATGQELPGAVIASLPGVAGLAALAPLKTVSPLSLSTPQAMTLASNDPAPTKTQPVQSDTAPLTAGPTPKPNSVLVSTPVTAAPTRPSSPLIRTPIGGSPSQPIKDVVTSISGSINGVLNKPAATKSAGAFGKISAGSSGKGKKN